MWDAILGGAKRYLGENAEGIPTPAFLRDHGDPNRLREWGSAGYGPNWGAGTDPADLEFVDIGGVPHVRLGPEWEGFANAGLNVTWDDTYGRVSPDVQGYQQAQDRQRQENASEGGIEGFLNNGGGVGLVAAMMGPVAMAQQLGGLSGIMSSFGAPAGMTGAEIAAGGMNPAGLMGGFPEGVNPWGVNPRDGLSFAGADPIETMYKAVMQTRGELTANQAAQSLGYGGFHELLSAVDPSWLTAGGNAAALLQRMGLNGAARALTSGAGIPLSGIVNAAGNLGGALLGRNASLDAAGIQADSAREAAGVQRYMFDTTRADAMPWLDAGKGALSRVQELLGLQPGADSGALMRNFSMADLMADPIYAATKGSQEDEMRKALTNAASARGETDSGVLLKDLLRYGTDLNNRLGGDAFNRFQSNRQAQYNFLAPTANLGQATGMQLGQVGQQAGQVIGQNITGAGNAEAAGRVGGANAISGGISNALQAWQNQQLLDRFLPRGSSVMAE